MIPRIDDAFFCELDLDSLNITIDSVGLIHLGKCTSQRRMAKRCKKKKKKSNFDKFLGCTLLFQFPIPTHAKWGCKNRSYLCYIYSVTIA